MYQDIRRQPYDSQTYNRHHTYPVDVTCIRAHALEMRITLQRTLNLLATESVIKDLICNRGQAVLSFGILFFYK